MEEHRKAAVSQGKNLTGGEIMSPHRQPTAMLERPNPFAALFQEIAEIAQAALRRSAYFELRDVSCDFRGGTLTLRGRLPSYHLKQLAQTAVAEVPGVVDVDNRVEVVAPRPAPAWSQRDVEPTIQHSPRRELASAVNA
jgi:hypothetical protein